MTKKILIIEDDLETQRGLATRFRAHGYQVETAAEAIMGQMLAQRGKPDLILLDLGLPAGDGLALLKRVKSLAATAAIPVIVLTGRDAQPHQEATRRAGAAAFFQKPAELGDLLAAIRRQIGGPDSGTAEPTATKKILVVEDDPVSRLGVTARLRKEGYDTAYASDAGTALTVAKKERPDLVLLDLGLPAGDGFVIIQRLREDAGLGGIPVIVLSGRDPEVNRPKALEAGARAYLHKPADMAELIAVIRKELGDPTHHGPPSAL